MTPAARPSAAPSAPSARNFSRLSLSTFRRFGEPLPFRASKLRSEPSSPRPGHPSESRFRSRLHERSGKVRVGILMWALGVPIPLILLFVLLRGCAA